MLTMKRHTAAGTIIPSRFLATIAHIIASIMAFITKVTFIDNIIKIKKKKKKKKKKLKKKKTINN